MDQTSLQEQIKAEALANYAALGGGWPIPLAGAVWWLFLTGLGTQVDPYMWSGIAFFTSGAIFPVALLFAKLASNRFMQAKSAVGSVLLPAFVSMLLFWPLAIAALWEANPLTPLILAVGMAIHWPVIGWSYGRVAPFIAHAVARAALGFGVWYAFPDERFVYVPATVAAVYLITVVVLLVDSRMVTARLARTQSNGG